jgi:hypothetical protein
MSALKSKVWLFSLKNCALHGSEERMRGKPWIEYTIRRCRSFFMGPIRPPPTPRLPPNLSWHCSNNATPPSISLTQFLQGQGWNYTTPEKSIILPFYYSMRGELIGFFNLPPFLCRASQYSPAVSRGIFGRLRPPPPQRGCSYQKEIERIDKWRIQDFKTYCCIRTTTEQIT